MLAALWLVVAIATVALALGVEAAEHRTMGLGAADRRIGEAAASGGLAIARSRLEQILRQPPRLTASMASTAWAADPWYEADSLFADTIWVGTVPVQVRVLDLSSKLGINVLTAEELRNFFAFVLRDYARADALAQAIVDWRDRDDFPGPRGAERKEYLDKRRLHLPTNRRFEHIDELRFVEGMTPEIFAQIRPALRVDNWGRGDMPINVNTAPEPVLRAIPGMTDRVVTYINAKRSRRQRVQDMAELASAGFRSNAANARWVKFTTDWIEVSAVATPSPSSRPFEAYLRVWKVGHSLPLNEDN